MVAAASVVTRFAPSPTGRLHVGNIRTALLNWLCARQLGGRFLLRIDDTDLERSREDYVDAIRADLGWLNLSPDGEARQSQRFALYEARFAALVDAGHVYACYETPEELDMRRKVLLSRGLPPVYERKPVDAPVPAGVAPHWRFRLDHDRPIAWTDLIRGDQHFDPAKLSDPVIRRADGSWLYMLPSVIDDVDMGVSHIVRGEDHVSNTAVQIQMFDALRASPPVFAHAALLTGSEGKLSKRLGSLGCDMLREQGFEPVAVAALLARIGTSRPVEPVIDPQMLVAGFDFGSFGRAPARFDEAELTALNQKIVHQLPHARVADRLPPGMNAAAWEAIRPNLETVGQSADWWAVVTGSVDCGEVPDEDRPFLAQAAQVLAALPWTDDIWHQLTGALKAASGRKGKALFLPLRRALTGRDHGPDMAALLPLIGRTRALGRLGAD